MLLRWVDLYADHIGGKAHYLFQGPPPRQRRHERGRPPHSRTPPPPPLSSDADRHVADHAQRCAHPRPLAPQRRWHRCGCGRSNRTFALRDRWRARRATPAERGCSVATPSLFASSMRRCRCWRQSAGTGRRPRTLPSHTFNWRCTAVLRWRSWTSRWRTRRCPAGPTATCTACEWRGPTRARASPHTRLHCGRHAGLSHNGSRAPSSPTWSAGAATWWYGPLRPRSRPPDGAHALVCGAASEECRCGCR